MPEASADITQKLLALRGGDEAAWNELFQAVYGQLRRMARRQLVGRPPGASLDTTVLIHEAYLKLVEGKRATWQDRNHFFAVGARVMRQIVIDHARAKRAGKRGGGAEHIELRESQIGIETKQVDLLALEDALTRLERLDERLSRVVELRFFGGLSIEEIAALIGVTPRTVKRDWRKARAFLFNLLSDAGAPTNES